MTKRIAYTLAGILLAVALLATGFFYVERHEREEAEKREARRALSAEVVERIILDSRQQALAYGWPPMRVIEIAVWSDGSMTYGDTEVTR